MLPKLDAPETPFRPGQRQIRTYVVPLTGTVARYSALYELTVVVRPVQAE
jgi:hypothetical protein